MFWERVVELHKELDVECARSMRLGMSKFGDQGDWYDGMQS